MSAMQIQAWSIDPAIYGKPVTLCRPAVAPGSELSPGGMSNYHAARAKFDKMSIGSASRPLRKATEKEDRQFFYLNEVNHRQEGKDPWKAVNWLMEHQGAKESEIPAEWRRHLIWDAKKGNGVSIR